MKEIKKPIFNDKEEVEWSSLVINEIEQGSEFYPKVLEAMGSAAPSKLTCIGNIDLLKDEILLITGSCNDTEEETSAKLTSMVSEWSGRAILLGLTEEDFRDVVLRDLIGRHGQRDVIVQINNVEDYWSGDSEYSEVKDQLDEVLQYGGLIISFDSTNSVSNSVERNINLAAPVYMSEKVLCPDCDVLDGLTIKVLDLAKKLNKKVSINKQAYFEVLKFNNA